MPWQISMCSDDGKALPLRSHFPFPSLSDTPLSLSHTFSQALTLTPSTRDRDRDRDVPAVRSHGGDAEQGLDHGLPHRHRRPPLRRPRRRQHRSSPRQQVRLREVRGSQALARSHRSGLRRLQFLPSGPSVPLSLSLSVSLSRSIDLAFLSVRILFGCSEKKNGRETKIILELQVVKNVASQSLEVKKLVYLYLLHYAEKYVVLRLLTVISMSLLLKAFASELSGLVICFLGVKLGFL